jgi:hypothetical protein
MEPPDAQRQHSEIFSASLPAQCCVSSYLAMDALLPAFGPRLRRAIRRD